MLGFDTFYMCANFDDFSLNRSINTETHQGAACDAPVSQNVFRPDDKEDRHTGFISCLQNRRWTNIGRELTEK